MPSSGLAVGSERLFGAGLRRAPRSKQTGVAPGRERSERKERVSGKSPQQSFPGFGGGWRGRGAAGGFLAGTQALLPREGTHPFRPG